MRQPRNTPEIDSSPTLNVNSQYKRSQVKFDKITDNTNGKEVNDSSNKDKSMFKSKGYTLGENYSISVE